MSIYWIPKYYSEYDYDYVLVGIPYEEGVTGDRTGTIHGPDGIRDQLNGLKLHNVFHGVNVSSLKGGDSGDLHISDVVEFYEKLPESAIPIGLGGDHSITYKELEGLYARAFLSGTKLNIGLLHIDAHHDMVNTNVLTHGSVFYHAIEDGLLEPKNVLQIGMRGSTSNEYPESKDIECVRMGLFDIIKNKMGVLFETKFGKMPVFISIDIDSVDPAFAPGVSVPEVGGFTSREILYLVRSMFGLNIIGVDVVETNPEYDMNDITSLLSATIVFELISLIARGK